MNWDQIKGNWSVMKGKVKQKWGDLSNDELDRIDGEREQLIGHIQKRYGIAKEDAAKQVDEFSRSKF